MVTVDALDLDESQRNQLQKIAANFEMNYDALLVELQVNLSRYFAERVHEEVEFWLDKWAE